MNAHTKIEAETSLPATLPNLDELVDARNKAINLWIKARADFHATTALAGSVCPAASLSLGRFDDRFDRYAQLGHSFTGKGKEAEYAALVTKRVDQMCWSDLARRANAKDLMDREAREQWDKSLEEPAPFSVENIQATFGHLWENRGELFRRGIANAFAKLDRRFRSHDGFKIGSRIILNGALNDSGYWQYGAYGQGMRDTLDDVENAFIQISGEPLGEDEPPMSQRIENPWWRHYDTPHVIEGKFFRVRVFRNGNLHLWFERKDLVREINKLLAEYYGETIGDGYDTTEADDTPGYNLTPAKKFGEFFTSDELADLIFERHVPWTSDMRVLEPSAGGGALVKQAIKRGAANVTCVEIQRHLALALAEMNGIDRVLNEDFLKLGVDQLGQFDLVVMNPPFDRGRDADHVRHAWQFVKPGGALVSIMSAGAEYREDKRHKALHKIVKEAEPVERWGRGKWTDLPERSFAHAGTNVNTIVLAIRKKA